ADRQITGTLCEHLVDETREWPASQNQGRADTWKRKRNILRRPAGWGQNPGREEFIDSLECRTAVMPDAVGWWFIWLDCDGVVRCMRGECLGRPLKGLGEEAVRKGRSGSKCLQHHA
ncbi:hypothetical protein JMJ77_0000213, partial [Colletotrichum scovillei]